MTLRFKLLALLCVVLSVSAFADSPKAGKSDQKMVSLGRVAQATAPTKVYAKPNTRAHVYYSVQPQEYLVVQDYKKDSPWKKVLLQNMHYGYAQVETMSVLAYEYKVPETPVAVTEPSRSALTSRGSVTRFSGRGSDNLRAAVADYALNFKGTPYVWGGNNLVGGIDCSGFVKQLYGQIGMNLPRTAAEQVNVGVPIRRLEDLRKGDRLYFWDYKRNCVGHTGIYLGKGYFVHSSMTHKGVDTDYLGQAKWMRLLVAARR
jgi:cell wall-associated NlpC family hydrolase